MAIMPNMAIVSKRLATKNPYLKTNLHK